MFALQVARLELWFGLDLPLLLMFGLGFAPTFGPQEGLWVQTKQSLVPDQRDQNKFGLPRTKKSLVWDQGDQKLFGHGPNIV